MVRHRTGGSLMATIRNDEVSQRSSSADDKLRLVIDTVPALVWSGRPDGSRDLLNQRWLDYTGLSLEEGLGTFLCDS
jgi:PAS domain-containing protein